MGVRLLFPVRHPLNVVETSRAPGIRPRIHRRGRFAKEAEARPVKNMLAHERLVSLTVPVTFDFLSLHRCALRGSSDTVSRKASLDSCITASRPRATRDLTQAAIPQLPGYEDDGMKCTLCKVCTGHFQLRGCCRCRGLVSNPRPTFSESVYGNSKLSSSRGNEAQPSSEKPGPTADQSTLTSAVTNFRTLSEALPQASVRDCHVSQGRLLPWT